MDTGSLDQPFGLFPVDAGHRRLRLEKSTSNSEEYMLGGRNLSPSVAALSAGASDMSGWLLLPAGGAVRLGPVAKLDRHRSGGRRLAELADRRPPPAPADRGI